MKFQKCPVCDGLGQISDKLNVSGKSSCPHCKGKRIIDTNTGEPPATVEVKESISKLKLND
jgi:DnaJ-class molecular chaperone